MLAQKCISALVILATVLTAWAEPDRPPVEYTVTLDEPQTQMAGISVTVDGVSGPHIDFMLPVWRPGRYVVMNMAQSIRDFRAFDGSGRPLNWRKIDKTTWRVEISDSEEVRIEYRVYCNSLNDRTRHVDDSHAFLSGSAIFMYAEQWRNEPCIVRIRKPEGWRIACGLDSFEGDPDALFAENYDRLVDSPMEIGLQDVIDFEAAGKPHQIVIWGEADKDAEQLKRDFSKIVEEQTRVFGSSPYERYLFIVHAGAGASGGTEHVNSTIMQTSRAALEQRSAYERFLNLVAHEFFHTWNIKAFRPRGLIPYNYQRENYTDLLWVAEGTTTYYAGLTLVRTGLNRTTRYLESLSTSIDSMRKRPSETVQSVAEASFDSWIHYGSRTPDDVNSQVDFYGKGALVSLALDLEMRRRSAGRASLDDLMRALYERFPLAAGQGYSVEQLHAIVEELTGEQFDEFFDRYVRGAQPLELEAAFEHVGIELYFRPGAGEEAQTGGRRGSGSRRSPGDQREDGQSSDDQSREGDSADQPDTQPEDAASMPKETAYLGLNLADGVGSTSGRTTVSSILSDGPAYRSGLAVGDEIIAIDDQRVSASGLNDLLREYTPGAEIVVTYFRRDELRTTRITLSGRPDGRWTLRKIRDATDEQKAAYKAWLGQDW